LILELYRCSCNSWILIVLVESS